MQKKSLTITVIALAAISAVWLGGTWYTGSKIEEQYLKHKLTTSTNKVGSKLMMYS